VRSAHLARWFDDLGLGRTAAAKAVPDALWARPDADKRALLEALWDGAGSGREPEGRAVVVRSPRLADGVLRLLGDLGTMAEIERDAGGGARIRVRRGAVAGYRRLSKNAAWVRVGSVTRRPYCGPVFSVHVPEAETVVATGGLVVHNCFPKDTRAMVRIAEDHGYDFDLLRGVIGVNDEQYERMVAKVESAVGGSVQGVAVAAWGLTFKARTDDVRDSPAIEVLRRLQARGATVRAYDPGAPRSSPLLEGLDVLDDAYAVCENADVLVVLTEWDEFRWLDFAKVAGLMRAPRIVDTRNLLEPAAVRRRGFTYVGLGRL
jgi:hypothetical protein